MPRVQVRNQFVPTREGRENEYDSLEDSSSDEERNYQGIGRNGPPGSPPDESGAESDDESAINARVRPFRPAPVHFDAKLKPESIPEWDGNIKGLSEWIISINNIADSSSYTRIQLGSQVPLRFTNRALKWFNALDKSYRRQITADWPTLRRAITIHFMNRTVMERNKANALNAKFRDKN
ncbi:hypothetical protein RSAG8_06187, partial [Rhizoctonia solani AG-8 WAC10335]